MRRLRTWDRLRDRLADALGLFLAVLVIIAILGVAAGLWALKVYVGARIFGASWGG